MFIKINVNIYHDYYLKNYETFIKFQLCDIKGSENLKSGIN